MHQAWQAVLGRMECYSRGRGDIEEGVMQAALQRRFGVLARRSGRGARRLERGPQWMATKALCRRALPKRKRARVAVRTSWRGAPRRAIDLSCRIAFHLPVRGHFGTNAMFAASASNCVLLCPTR